MYKRSAREIEKDTRTFPHILILTRGAGARRDASVAARACALMQQACVYK